MIFAYLLLLFERILIMDDKTVKEVYESITEQQKMALQDSLLSI